MVGHKCPKCGKVMGAAVCPCEHGRLVLAEDGLLGKKGEVRVVDGIVRNERGHGPRRKPKASEVRLADAERRLLAEAIRGPLDRFDVSGSKLYADLRAGGVDHEAAHLLVEAFGRKERLKRKERSRA